MSRSMTFEVDDTVIWNGGSFPLFSMTGMIISRRKRLFREPEYEVSWDDNPFWPTWHKESHLMVK